MRKFLIVATLAGLAVPAIAQGSPANTIQPANVYFGNVMSGNHPTQVVTVQNRTGHNIHLTAHPFRIAGAGGRKFTLASLQPGGAVATCAPNKQLRVKESCTLIYRVKTRADGFWQAVVNVQYTSPHGTNHYNGAVYAHVVH